MTTSPLGRLAVPLLACLAAACVDAEPTDVTLTGTVFDGPEDDAAPLPGADLTVRNPSGGITSTATADADGAFSIALNAGTGFNLTCEAEGFVSTTFAGLAGTGSWHASDGLVWLRSDESMAALDEEFTGCTRTGEGGGVIEGEVRLAASNADPETMPLVNSATVTAYESDGTEVAACYLDDEGVSAPESTVTGATGRFAVFGVPEGPITVEVTYVHSEAGDSTTTLYFIWLPENSLAPMYPAYANLPG